MTDFKTTYNGHEIIARVHSDGSINYLTEAIQEQGKYYSSAKEFTSLKACEAAIDKYDLSLRKEFTNTTAYTIEPGYHGAPGGVDAVTVTSITSDGTEAWIKTAKHERRKVTLTSLYTCPVMCKAYLEACAESAKVYSLTRADLLSTLRKSAWVPKGKE